jgi:hypothetical protein
MRFQLLAAALAASVFAVPALADDAPDQATLDKVLAVATRGYAHPETAKLRNVHKSAAKNGLGWCGEVTVENGDGYTIFHAILADDKGNEASVLRLVDYPDSDTSRNAEMVRRMMVNFGCTK